MEESAAPSNLTKSSIKNPLPLLLFSNKVKPDFKAHGNKHKHNKHNNTSSILKIIHCPDKMLMPKVVPLKSSYFQKLH